MPIAHKFSYFSAIHIETFIVSIVLCTILFFIPKIFKNINLKYYNIFLGILAIVSKIVDSIFRVVSEHEPVYIYVILPFYSQDCIWFLELHIYLIQHIF